MKILVPLTALPVAALLLAAPAQAQPFNIWRVDREDAREGHHPANTHHAPPPPIEPVSTGGGGGAGMGGAIFNHQGTIHNGGALYNLGYMGPDHLGLP